MYVCVYFEECILRQQASFIKDDEYSLLFLIIYTRIIK